MGLSEIDKKFMAMDRKTAKTIGNMGVPKKKKTVKKSTKKK